MASPISPCIDCDQYQLLGCTSPEGKCMKRLEWEQQKTDTTDIRVWGYCPLCGVNLFIFIGTLEECKQHKAVHACHRCQTGLVTSELIKFEYKKGILAPYTISIPEIEDHE